MRHGRKALLPVLFFLWMLVPASPASANVQAIYTLPFQGQGYISLPQGCFGCYPGHEGTDYVLGGHQTEGNPVIAAARGIAKSCNWTSTAGYSVLVDHGSGHRTRYLHLYQFGLPSAGGQLVARGQVIGYEGSTGYTDPTGFIHLHFEARDNASTFTCSSPWSGTAVDPYTGWWNTNPPSTARDLEFSGDGYPDVLARETSTGTICLVRGNGTGGWNGNGDPGCFDGSPIGWGWNVFDLIFRPGDFSGDGYPDVLARMPDSGGLLCHRVAAPREAPSGRCGGNSFAKDPECPTDRLALGRGSLVSGGPAQ